jgi:hypothetical protein
LVDQFAEVGQLGGRELAPFHQVGGQAFRGTVKHAGDELPHHPLGRRFLGDLRLPHSSAAGAMTGDESFIAHHAEHGGDGRRRDVALGAEPLDDVAERQGTLLPQDAEDF